VTYRTLAKGHGGSCAPAAKALTINDDQPVNAQISARRHVIGDWVRWAGCRPGLPSQPPL
jgi:hypothetical protein